MRVEIVFILHAIGSEFSNPHTHTLDIIFLLFQIWFKFNKSIYEIFPRFNVNNFS